MPTAHVLSRLLATAALALAAVTAMANPVVLRLNGQITGYDYIDLGTAAGLTVGLPVDLTLRFNETWSDGTYDFSDPIGPVSGSASIGSYAFTFTGGTPYAMIGNGSTVLTVQPFFTGTGPTLGGGDFFGLFGGFTPALTLDYLLLGYGFTTVFPDGSSGTSYGYARISLDDYTITPDRQTPLPTPATLPLAALALAITGALRRTRRAA